MMDNGDFTRAAATMTLEQVEGWRDLGAINSDQWEAYACAWQLSTYRYSDQLKAYEVPSSGEVRDMAVMILDRAGCVDVEVPMPIG